MLTRFAESSIEVDYTPVPHPYAPLVFMAFELLASCGARIFGQRQNPAVDAAKDGIVEGVEFFVGGRFDDDGVVSHAIGCASSDWRGIARKGRFFPCGAIRK